MCNILHLHLHPPKQTTSFMFDFYFIYMVQDNDAQVKTAFNTLLTYVKNVATKPDEEKFRKIRLSNAIFQVILFFFFPHVLMLSLTAHFYTSSNLLGLSVPNTFRALIMLPFSNQVVTYTL